MQIIEERLRIEFHIVREGGFRLSRPANRLIIDVGEIHHLGDAIALIDEVAPHDVFEHEGSEVADVGVIVDRGSTCIKAHLARVNRLKIFLDARQGVIEA